MSEYEDIRYEQSGTVAEFVLDRPDKRNALRKRTLIALHSAYDRARENDVTAIVVRSGVSGMFSAGADLDLLERYRDDPPAFVEFLEEIHAVYDTFEQGPMPVIACVDGPALAGGLELVLACDLAVASTTAEFGDQHINVNLFGGGGGTQRLPRIVGPRRAKQLVLTGDRISAERAQEWGLVNYVSETPLEAARDLGEKLGSHHPAVLAKSKELLAVGSEEPLDVGLALEREKSVVHHQTDAAREGLAEFLGE